MVLVSLEVFGFWIFMFLDGVVFNLFSFERILLVLLIRMILVSFRLIVCSVVVIVRGFVFLFRVIFVCVFGVSD